jgi:hypothetical protein
MNEVQVVQEGDTGEQLLCELLDVRAWEWDEAIRLEEVEDALSIEVRDNADVVSEVEAVSQMDTPVDIEFVV